MVFLACSGTVRQYIREGSLSRENSAGERDIENEIKSTEVDDSQVAELLATVLFKDVLRDQKIRYEGNLQDYAYARRLDDELIGRDADVAINIITPGNFHHTDAATLAAHNMGKAELLAVLPDDTSLTDQAWLYLKTQKYVQQNTGSGDETRKAILALRSQQNSTRRTNMQEGASELLRKAPLYLNGSRLDTVGEGDARNPRTAFDGAKSGACLFPVERLNQALLRWLRFGGEYRSRIEGADDIKYTTTNDAYRLSRPTIRDHCGGGRNGGDLFAGARQE
jgi:hypothetical protein